MPEFSPALPVAVWPENKVATPVLVFAFLPARDSLARQTQALVHASAAIPPQAHSDLALSTSNGREITNLGGLSSLGHPRIHTRLLSDDLSGPDDLLGISVLATQALKHHVTHLSKHGMMLPLIGVAKHKEINRGWVASVLTRWRD
jgi:hypothetical protein